MYNRKISIHANIDKLIDICYNLSADLFYYFSHIDTLESVICTKHFFMRIEKNRFSNTRFQ